MEWKILRLNYGDQQMEVAKFSGSAVEVLAFAATLPEPDPYDFPTQVIVSEGECFLPDPQPGWVFRTIYERRDRKGRNIEEKIGTDHGGWFTSPRDPVSYFSKRNSKQICVFHTWNQAGRLLQIVLHDGTKGR